jgi:hypothetical protein
VFTVTFAQVQIRTARWAQTRTIFAAEHLLGQSKDNKLPNVVCQIDMRAVGGKYLDFLAVTLHSFLFRDKHDTVSGGDILLKLFETSVACEDAPGPDLHLHVQLPARLLKRRLDLQFLREPGIETYLFGCRLEGMMMCTFRDFRNIDSKYAHRSPPGFPWRSQKRQRTPEKSNFFDGFQPFFAKKR